MNSLRSGRRTFLVNVGNIAVGLERPRLGLDPNGFLYEPDQLPLALCKGLPVQLSGLELWF